MSPLITRRSQVQILPPLPSFCVRPRLHLDREVEAADGKDHLLPGCPDIREHVGYHLAALFLRGLIPRGQQFQVQQGVLQLSPPSCLCLSFRSLLGFGYALVQLAHLCLQLSGLGAQHRREIVAVQ